MLVIVVSDKYFLLRGLNDDLLFLLNLLIFGLSLGSLSLLFDFGGISSLHFINFHHILANLTQKFLCIHISSSLSHTLLSSR